MKRTNWLVLGFVAMAANACFAQYYEFTFGNRIPDVIDAPIYGPEIDYFPAPDWANAKTGNTTNGIPPGGQIYHGRLPEGWKVMFMAGVGELDSGRELWPGDVVLTLGSGTDAGYFPTTTVRFWIPTNAPSDTVGTFQVRVWDGRVSERWPEDLSAAGTSGASALFTGTFGGVSTEFRSFSAGWLDSATLAPIEVPEPSGLTLVVGALLLGKWRRV